MKALFTTTLVLAMLAIICTSDKSLAQSGTLTVYANGPTIDQVISNDATNGIQKHAVYQLVSRDTTYLLDATITLKSGVSIVGVKDPVTGKLPCIEADILTSGQIPGIFFTLTGQGTRVTLKNLYLLGIAPNRANNTGSGQGVQVSADSISLTIDNCVFDYMAQFEIGYSSNWNNFYITNSVFRNGVDVASAYYVPELLRSQNYNGAWSTDTININNNTLIGIAMGPVVTTGITHYFNFSHNDVLLSTKSPLWSEQVVNATIDNNIFYDTYATGVTHTEYAGGWDEIRPPRIPAIISLTGLDSTKAAMLLGHARNSSADSLAAEALRKVEIKNNVYFWSTTLTNWWKTWNDTATTAFDSIYTPVFMNSETQSMFSNTTTWPNFDQSGNQSVDPGFGTTITTDALNGTDTTYGVGLLAYIAAVRGGQGTTQSYAYQKTIVGTNADWTPIWPLPERNALVYSNQTLKTGATDGTAIGDTNFSASITAVESIPTTIPNKFELYNAYPNPFNPSTNIKFNLAQNGNVSLKVYNMVGQLVRTIVDNIYSNKGEHEYNVNMDNLSSGVYFYTLTQGAQTITKKMVLLK